MAKNIQNALSEDCVECNVTDSGINQILTQLLNTNKQILELSERVNAISTQNMAVNSLTEAPSISSTVPGNQYGTQCQICEGGPPAGSRRPLGLLGASPCRDSFVSEEVEELVVITSVIFKNISSKSHVDCSFSYGSFGEMS
ncbi:hypothetical protein AVEN_148913-1 [Araneus ventricosus]|uniref:Uncharacterized protein n=1 Tax=Araneus ventricosus TaxID=182803 RepID=A0A4Y2DIF5_ARAVE|nr:hypothetical protein AVEN_148913-1 [Araneus ventricosus]